MPRKSVESTPLIRVSTKIGPKHQVTIPQEVFKSLHLSIGDYLEFELREKSARITPKKLISKEDVWFHSSEWQKKEQEVDRAICNGDISGPFTTASALLKHLRKTKRGSA